MAFPETIFNGTHPQRKDLGTITSADYFDYLILAREIGAVQKYVKDLAQNIGVMPDLSNQLDRAQQKIDAVKLRLSELTPPEDLKQQLVDLEVRVKEVDTHDQVASLRRDIETLRILITDSQLEVLKLTQAFQTEVKSFQNQVWTTLRQLQSNVEERLTALETKMGQLNNLVQINNLLSKLQ